MDVSRLHSAGPTLLRDGAGVVGAVLIAVGVGMVYLPAGLIVAGALMLAAAVFSARASA